MPDNEDNMKRFKFFQKERKPIFRRQYLGINPGVLNAMIQPVGRIHYMEYDTSVGADDGDDRIPEVTIEMRSCSVVASIRNVPSLNWFKEENRNNYIWIYQWKLPDDEEFTLFTSDEDPDIPQDVPLVIRCVVKSN